MSLPNPKDLLGIKKTPLRLTPPALDIWVSGVMAGGKSKYGELYDIEGYDGHNWRGKKVRLSVYLEAIKRHLLATIDGEWFDPDDGMPHAAHIGACVAIVLDAKACGSLIEDLPPMGTASKLMQEVVSILQRHAEVHEKNEQDQRERKTKKS